MIAIVDYGMGNLRSVQKGFERVGHSAVLVTDPHDVESAEKLVLPGVGAFGACMQNLTKQGLVDPIVRFIESGRPFLGICLGLQVLFTESEEMGCHPGLGIVPGRVVRFPEREDLIVPHMGWNRVQWKQTVPLTTGIRDGEMFYFVHSYYGVPDDPSVVAGSTCHGIDFCSALVVDNVFAVQFHPEKSSRYGLQILKNFGDL